MKVWISNHPVTIYFLVAAVSSGITAGILMHFFQSWLLLPLF
jgi:hypothetical protein